MITKRKCSRASPRRTPGLDVEEFIGSVWGPSQRFGIFAYHYDGSFRCSAKMVSSVYHSRKDLSFFNLNGGVFLSLNITSQPWWSTTLCMWRNVYSSVGNLFPTNATLKVCRYFYGISRKKIKTLSDHPCYWFH